MRPTDAAERGLAYSQRHYFRRHCRQIHGLQLSEVLQQLRDTGRCASGVLHIGAWKLREAGGGRHRAVEQRTARHGCTCPVEQAILYTHLWFTDKGNSLRLVVALLEIDLGGCLLCGLSDLGPMERRSQM